MTHNLILVESPAIAKRVASFLGEGWRVEATRGPVRDLPQDTLGVTVDDDFRPDFQVLPRQINTVRRLIQAMQTADAIYLATAPDHDGEALAWHVLQLADLPADRPVSRVYFAEITADAVKAALDAPRPLDMRVVEAHQARRILDRLVGYLVSPVASKALGVSHAVGRAQSNCLHLIVQREKHIAAFTPESFWTLGAQLKAGSGAFLARLRTIKGQPVERLRTTQVTKLTAGLNGAVFWVGSITHHEQLRNPEPPFTTSTLLQSASRVLGLSPARTMQIAHRLYEAGLITYPYTKGMHVPPKAQRAALQHIARTYGGDYVPNRPHNYESAGANALGLHDAIRPTDVTRVPGEQEGDGAALYALIWRRFIASQMAPARYAAQVIQVLAGKTQGQPYPLDFEATGRTLNADGFQKVYKWLPDAEADITLPFLQEETRLYLDLWKPVEHKSAAPPRFTEATLSCALEQTGITRSAEYASAVQTLTERGCVTHKDEFLVPTAAGLRLYKFLSTHLPLLCHPCHAAALETAINAVAAGDMSRVDVLKAFWATFTPQVGAASRAAQQAKERRPPRTSSASTQGQRHKPVTLHNVSRPQGA